MKSTVVYGLVVMAVLALAQLNLTSTFGGDIDYKKIYKNECQKCHNYDGKGTKRGKRLGAPDFTDAKWQASVTDEQLIDSITNGKKRMPKQDGRLSPEEIKEMVKYIRFFAPKE